MAKQLIDLNNRLGFNLPAQEKAIVIHDPAAVEMYPRLRAAVSLYREMGHAIIKTAYASYLYQTMGPGPAYEMSQILHGCVERIGGELMSSSYDTKMTGGTAHEPIFESCLSVGSYNVIGCRRSKKLAETDAAIKYVRQFGLSKPMKKAANASYQRTIPRSIAFSQKPY